MTLRTGTEDQKPSALALDVEHFAATGWRIVTALNPKENPMTATNRPATDQHTPVVLIVGDVLCLDGECQHLDDDANVHTCPLIGEVTVCGACSTVTTSELGEEWGPTVTWPCLYALVA